jgi:EAL domain-containing protein (putative c-di-GMP-specific phosphodiesterase class I)
MLQLANRAEPRVRSDAVAKLAAFAFCRADLLLELNSDFEIEFSSAEMGEKKSIFKPGLCFPEMLNSTDKAHFVHALNTLNQSGRIVDLNLNLKVAEKERLNCRISGYRVPDFGNNYFLAIKYKTGAVGANIISGARHDRESGVYDKDSFGAIAVNKIRAFQESGNDAALSLLKLQGLESARENLSEKGYGALIGQVADSLKQLSIDEDSVGRIANDSFALVHGPDVDKAQINEQIGRVSEDVLGAKNELISTVETLEITDKALSETELANVLSFTVRRFTRSKGKLDTGGLSTLINEMTIENVKVVQMFKRLCRTREFNFVFMPICNLKTGAVHHYEILSRFPKLEGTGISTFDMMSLAEEVGAISDFDLAAAQKAINMIKGEIGRGSLPAFALNISGQSIINETFMEKLTGLLKSFSNLSKHLKFEITESAEIDNLEKANEHIQTLREMGFAVSLDDFGSGAASFDYLNALKVDVVKFDGPVVRRALSTDMGRDFLAAMAALCARSGIETVAEMVEDAAMASNLTQFGIDFGQGYHFGKPSPGYI